jgi:uncharacterized protein (DUF2252 family)
MVEQKKPTDVKERIEQGKAVRSRVPRQTFGEWEPAADRPDPLQLLVSQEAGRLQELIPLRRRRMLESPFTFFRGAAVVQAADLGAMPATMLHVQCCGDAHVGNFGGFEAPDRNMIFDINDFDETSRGPFEWDLMRLAASFEIAGRTSGGDASARGAVVAAAIGSYREAMARFAGDGNLDVWYARLDEAKLRELVEGEDVTPEDVKRFEKRVRKAREKNRYRALKKMTERDGDAYRLASEPPRLVPVRELPDADAVTASLEHRWADYLKRLDPALRTLLEGYHVVDAARNTVGVGSVGMRGWVLLLMGRDNDDPLFLQLKEAGESVLEPYAGKSAFASHAQRVVEGQRLLQTTGDILLGWTRSKGSDGVERDYYVRQLWDGKLKVPLEALPVVRLARIGKVAAWTLAKGHARSGDRVAISGYLGSGDEFDRSMAAYAARYADRNEADYAAAQEAWG